VTVDLDDGDFVRELLDRRGQQVGCRDGVGALNV
jgi:hypothetical protein